MPTNTNSNRRKSSQQPIDNTYGHLPPQAIEVERDVLGALLIDVEAFTLVGEMLTPETFYEPRHQKIYQAIQTLSLQQHPIDIATVGEQLKRDATFNDVGGNAYLVELSSHVTSSAHIEYHARILTQKWLARQLISFAGQVETKAFDESVDVDDLMQETETSLFELSKKNQRQDFMHIAPVLDQAINIIQELKGTEGGMTGVPTGYPKLDKLTSGWQKSDLVIVAGRPAMGKTTFALSLAKNAAVDHQMPVAVFSLEMTNVQLVNRLISNVCSIDGEKILSGQLDEAEFARLDKYRDTLGTAPIYIDETPSLRIFELRSKARRLVQDKGVKLIIIDYLQLMTARTNNYGSRQEEVATISRQLKGLAKELDIPVIALSQLNRGVDNRISEGDENSEAKEPKLSDLRESGAIEQDADMVIFVHRPEVYKIFKDQNGNSLVGKAKIIIAKHRKGAQGDVWLRFEGRYTRFSNLGDYGMPSFPTPPQGAVVASKVNTSNEADDDINAQFGSDDVPPPDTPF